MANGTKMLSFDEYKNLTPDEEKYHIYTKLSILHDLDNKFASKWVEKAMIYFFGMVIIAFAGAVIVGVIPM